VYDGDVPSAENCVSCGTYVTAATSFISEHGLLCWQCQTRIQNHQEAVARQVMDLQMSLNRRTAWNGRAHGTIWGVAAILAAAHLAGWFGGVVILCAFALGAGLAWRAQWAFWMALSLDIAGALGLIVLGATGPWTGAPLGVMFLAVFPGALALMNWTLRAAYEPSRADSGASHIGRIR